MRNVLFAAATLVVALVGASGSADPGFTAVDFEWLANGGPDTELTIDAGQTVTFAYPSGGSFHNVVFASEPSSCQGTQPANAGPGWQGRCTFDEAGTYAFVCGYHPGMRGRVIVRAPAPTPTSTVAPGASPTPAGSGGGPAPTPTPAPTARQTSLKLKLAAAQRGTRVRGSVDVRQAASRLEVTATARLAKARVRVGHSLQRSTASGRVAFAVALDAKARRVLRDRRRLEVTVRVTLTPPGAKPLTRAAKTRLTRG